jgi:hypothetical protein
MRPADILIYLHEGIDAGSRPHLDNALRRIPGVVAPWFPPNRRSLLFVYYNPGELNALRLIQRVRKLGYQASLVGF